MIIPALVLLDFIIGKTISDNTFKIVPPVPINNGHFHNRYIDCENEERCYEKVCLLYVSKSECTKYHSNCKLGGASLFKRVTDGCVGSWRCNKSYCEHKVSYSKYLKYLKTSVIW